MNHWTIGKVAKQTNIPASTIRYYEEIGLLPAAERINGRRHYTPTILKKLGLIRLAQQVGFSIKEIQTLINDFPENTPPSTRWQTLATDKLDQLNAQIIQIQAMKTLLNEILDCHCTSIDDCATDAYEMWQNNENK